jgi:hypothetical protein
MVGFKFGSPCAWVGPDPGQLVPEWRAVPLTRRGSRRPFVTEWRTGLQYPGGTRAVSTRVAHGPSVPGWLTGLQYPYGARAVSPRLAHGPSVPGWHTGRQWRMAHEPSVPECPHNWPPVVGRA